MHEETVLLPDGFVSVDADDTAEFEARLAESSTLAFRVAYAVLRHREDAEDVAQEAFAKAYRDFRKLRNRDRFRAWLVRLTWRLSLDRQRNDRRRAVRQRQMESDPLHTSGADEDLVARERAALVWGAVDALPPKLRIVIVLSVVEEHDVNSIAKLLGVPAGTVKSRLFLARRRLKERLDAR